MKINVTDKAIYIQNQKYENIFITDGKQRFLNWGTKTLTIMCKVIMLTILMITSGPQNISLISEKLTLRNIFTILGSDKNLYLQYTKNA